MKPRFFTTIAVLVLGSAAGHGAVLYSGLQNITVSSGFDSVYLDIDAFSSVPTQAAGWDVDVFFGGEAFGNSTAFQPVRSSVGVDTAILRMDFGSVVDASLNYFNDAAGSSDHVGNGEGQFASGSEGYVGFRFTENDGDGPYYGWMRVIFSNDGNVGTVLDWAYDDSGAAMSVGVVPEPSGILLGGLGVVLLGVRRRR